MTSAPHRVLLAGHRRELVLGRQNGDAAGTPSRDWRRSYALRLLVVDTIALAASSAAAIWARFGVDPTAQTHGAVRMPYEVLSLVVGIGWMTALHGFGTRDPRIVGEGSLEYRRVGNATAYACGMLAFASLVLKLDMSRGYLAVAFPLGLLALLLGRKQCRVWLRHQRRLGHAMSRVLVLGSVGPASEIEARLRGSAYAGLRIVGVWTPGESHDDHPSPTTPATGLPLYDRRHGLPEVLASSGADMVVVSDTDQLGHHGLRELLWQLDDSEVDLMVSPSVVDVVDGRLRLTTVASMPFLSIDEPRYAEAAAWPKQLFDRTLAGLLLLAFSPLLVVTALAVKLSSPGPVFYLQERIGKDGVPFRMAKFRSMRQHADDELQALLAEAGRASQPLGKLDSDPRVTTVGAFLRRFSIDELPQLVSVVTGDMSLVGPRPQRDFEVAMYDAVAHRRLRVRPGITGLWQVSGRSDLSWEDAVRLDTYYVENWSMAADLVILWRTVRAVVSGEGAC